MKQHSCAPHSLTGRSLRLGVLLSLSLSLVGLSGCGQKQENAQDSGAETTAATQPDASSEPQATPKAAPGSVELGEACEKDEDCKSKVCVVEEFEEGGKVEQIKLCGACRDDAQCIAEKKGLSCQRSFLTGATECMDGELGAMCQKKEHCAGNLMCALVNMGDNESQERSCSECEKHIDCPVTGKRNCVSRDKTDENGEYYNLCLEDGARQTGEICFPCETGNRECAEGFCVKVELDDGMEDDFCIGVCGSCHTDADCEEGSRCVPPELNFEGEGIAPHKGSKCVKKG